MVGYKFSKINMDLSKVDLILSQVCLIYLVKHCLNSEIFCSI